MDNTLLNRIKNDLQEGLITCKVALAFIPIAFLSYLFHEFGHWTIGEILGNNMSLGLNNSAPQNGFFIKESHALWSAIGGPAFTIVQALIFLFVVWLTKSIYAYSVVFFAGFMRSFSIVFGGIRLQDEGRIASMVGVNMWLIALIELSVLFLILWKSNKIMNLNIKTVGYFTLLGTMAILIVIKTNSLI